MNKKLKKGLTVSSAAAMGMSIVLPTVSVIAAPAVTNGWVNQNGTWYYYNNGTLVKNGWAKDSKGWAFLSAVDGSWVQEGWAKDSTGWGYIRNGYWVEHATYAKDANGWEFIGANGYWDSSVAPSATNPIDDATAAVVKAEGSKLAADVDAAKALVAKLQDAIPEKAALTTRLNAVVTNFEVGSVSVVDANHIKVVFTQAVDAATATDVDNYTIGSDDNVIDEIEVQEDGKSVIIKLNEGKELTNDTSDDYTVKITDVKNTSGKVMDAYKEVLSLYDDVKPTISSLNMKNRDELQITFSEDVTNVNSTNVKVYDEDGSKVSFDKIEVDTDDHNVVNIYGLGDEDEGTYTVEISNVKDLAGNKIVADTTEEFNLAEDDTDPDVQTMKAISYTTLKITFSEPVDLKNSDSFTVKIGDDEIKPADTDLTAVSGTNKAAWYVKVTTDATKYDVDSSFKIKVSGYEDFAGNTGDSYTKFVKFGETAPTLESTEGTIKTFDGDKYAVFTYDDDVNGLIYPSKITDVSYVDEDGDEVDVDGTDLTSLKSNVYSSSSDGFDDYLDDNQIAIALSGLEKGDYTVTLPDGFAKVNDVESDETDVTFNVAEKSTSDVTVKSFAHGSSNDTYIVTFSDEVGSSALDTGNYEVDGSSVFTKAVFVNSDKKAVKLTVGSGEIDSDIILKKGVTFTVENVKDADGNDVEDYDSYDDGGFDNTTGHKFTFSETTGPDVQSAALVKLDTIVVTFDQDVYGEIDDDDFEVTVDGESVDIDKVTPGDTTDWDATTPKGYSVYTITLEDEIDSDDSDLVKAGTSDNFDGTDEVGNDGITGTMKKAEIDEDGPTVSVTTTTVQPGTDVTVDSSENGTLYLVKSADIDKVTDLTTLKANKVAEVDNVIADTDVSIDTTTLADGAYKVYGVDALGNVSDPSKGTITVDGTAPKVTGVTDGSTTSLGTTPAGVTPAFTEGTAKLAKDGGTAATFTTGTAITEAGSYVLVVTDAVGNATTITFTITA